MTQWEHGIHILSSNKELVVEEMLQYLVHMLDVCLFIRRKNKSSKYTKTNWSSISQRTSLTSIWSTA